MKKYLTFALLAISILPACNSLQTKQEEEKALGYQCEQLRLLYNKSQNAKLVGNYITTVRERNEGNCQNYIEMLKLDLQGKCINPLGFNFSCNN